MASHLFGFGGDVFNETRPAFPQSIRIRTKILLFLFSCINRDNDQIFEWARRKGDHFDLLNVSKTVLSEIF